MAIIITTTNQHAGFEAGLTEERGEVLLDVVLLEDELTGSGRLLEVKPYDEPAEPIAGVAYPDEGIPLPGNRANVEAARDHYRAEAERLARRLEDLRTERAVTRYLDPTEARELAAVLWHYAGEVEARR